MILDDIEEARERGDLMAAARLGLVLRHFVETYLNQATPVELDRPKGAAAEAAPMPDAAPLAATLEQRVQALGFDAATAPWVRRRVEAYLAAMVRHFGLEFAQLQDRCKLELLMAETRCATCQETMRCHRFLTGAAGGDTPEEFCVNASLFLELQRRG
jgi:hypothetical protein